MRTRNSNFPNNSNVTIPRRRNRGRAPNIVEPELRTIVEVAPMAERTMEELLRAPTEGYGEAIVLPEINADHFEIKTNLLQLVQANPFHGYERENPHAHINSFKRITSEPFLRFKRCTRLMFIKLMMFPYSLEGNARLWESVSKTDERINKLADQLSTLVEIVSKKVVTPAPVKAVEEICATCSGPPCCTNLWNEETKETTDKEQTNFQGSTAHIPPPVNPIPIPEPDVPKTLPKPNIPYPSRLDNQKLREKASYQKEKIFQMFQDLRFDISFADALLLMPRFAPTIRNLLMNKEKLLELAKIPLNENCSAMLLKKLPEKLGDPGKFLIPCNFPGMDVCHALADLGASINLMPLSIWKKLSLPELTPTRMTLELADRSITHPKGLAEDVYVKVGKFHFPTDFVVVDFEADPRVPLILGRSFLRTGRALIDVYGEEITLRVDNEAITFNLDQTTRYSSTNDKSVNRIDIIDEVCEEYAPDFPWVSPVHCVPKKGGITVVANEENELILTHSKKCLPKAPELVIPDWNLPFELMCDASDFAIGAVLGQRKMKHFQPIHYASKTMTEAQIHYTTTEKEMLAVVYAFEKFRPYLVLSKSIVYTDHSALKYLMNKQDAKPRLLRWVLLLQEFDITIRDKKGSENLAADHLSRLENPHKDVLENKDINENFPLETLGVISSGSTPWFATIIKFPCRNFIIKGKTNSTKERIFNTLNIISGTIPIFFVFVRIKSFEGVCMGKKLMISSKLVMKDPPGAIIVPISPLKKYLMPVSFGQPYIEMPIR
ncbi:reverse transcriptase domain-containing protein [Tanacetum coccineum]